MELENMGNAVKIGDKIIPAVNIQVDVNDYARHCGITTMPGYDKDGVWWGIYFEILFEDGSLWVVTKDQPMSLKYDNWNVGEIETLIQIEYYDDWRQNMRADNPDTVKYHRTWESFLDAYDSRVWRMQVERDYTSALA